MTSVPQELWFGKDTTSVVAEKLLRELDRPSGAKAVIHFARLAARLKAAPFQDNAKADFFRKLFSRGLNRHRINRV
jgi:hypothetical protein